MRLDLSGGSGLSWYLGGSGSARMAGYERRASGLDSSVAGDDDEKLNLMELGVVVAKTALAVAFCLAVHWAALSWSAFF